MKKQNYKIDVQHKISKTHVQFKGPKELFEHYKNSLNEIKSSGIFPVVSNEFDYQFFFYTTEQNDVIYITEKAAEILALPETEYIEKPEKKVKTLNVAAGIIALLIILAGVIGFKFYNDRISEKQNSDLNAAAQKNGDKPTETSYYEYDTVSDAAKKSEPELSKTDVKETEESEDEFKLTYIDKNEISGSESQTAATFSGKGKLEVIFADVGQGDASIFITPDRKCFIIDTGNNNSDADNILKILKQKNISKIDAMLLTHPHKDHIGGALRILKKIKVLKVYDSGHGHATVTYKRILSEIKKQKIKYEIPERGKTLDWTKSLSVKVLHPQKGKVYSTNNSSIVLHIKFRNVSFMMTGDAEKEVEHELVNLYGAALKSTVLKMGHHCSNTSSSREFLNKVKPQYGIIQCGTGNTYGHPHMSTYNRIKKITNQIYRTDLNGNIYIETDGSSIKVKLENKTNLISFVLFKEELKIG